jgi:pimeloyl-ACP methyl ester carboxylesterase
MTYLMNLVLDEETKEPGSLSQLFTSIVQTSPAFTGPIYVINGESDGPNCAGNCSYPINKAAAVKELLYPAASNNSQYYLVPKCGHGINLHYGAVDAYNHIQAFVKSNGL